MEKKKKILKGDQFASYHRPTTNLNYGRGKDSIRHYGKVKIKEGCKQRHHMKRCLTMTTSGNVGQRKDTFLLVNESIVKRRDGCSRHAGDDLYWTVEEQARGERLPLRMFVRLVLLFLLLRDVWVLLGHDLLQEFLITSCKATPYFGSEPIYLSVWHYFFPLFLWFLSVSSLCCLPSRGNMSTSRLAETSPVIALSFNCKSLDLNW